MQRVTISQLVPGMVVAQDVYTYNFQLIVPKGAVLTDETITKLELYAIVIVYVEKESETIIKTLQKRANGEQSNLQMKTYSEKIQNSQDFRQFQNKFTESVCDFRNKMNDIVEKNATIDTEALLAEATNLLEGQRSGIHVFDMLHNMRQFDDLTYVHCINVALICNVMGEWLGWNRQERELLTLCGMLHDVGKLTIPEQIIRKPQKLTDEEYEIIKTHTIRGYNILKDKNINMRIKNSALMHHEKCDGSGYPMALKADKIDRFAKVVAIADVYDAMTSARVYRGPLCPFQVIDIFESEGLQRYDPKYIMIFLERIVMTYMHNNVILSNGEKGEIVMTNAQRPGKPVVQVGNKFIDLGKEKNLSIQSII